MRLRNDLAPPISAIVGNCILAIILGSVFYNLPETTDSFYSRGALLFFATLLNAFTSGFEVRKSAVAEIFFADIPSKAWDAMGAATDSRKASDVCLLPSSSGGDCVHDLRLAEQDS